MFPSLDEVLSSQPVDEATASFTVASGFGQGKATFGGLVVGACVRSMARRLSNPERKLRSVSAQLIGAPMPGPATIRTRLLRASATVTTLSAELEQGGVVMTNVVGVFANDRPVALTWNSVTAPPVPSWRDVEPLDMNHPFAPEFTRNFEFRNTGPLPFSGSHEPPSGFIRPVTPCRVRDAGFITCLVDAWWLATFSRIDELRPAATLTFTSELHAPIDDLEPDAPLLHVGEALTLNAGYALETRRLFGVDGRLVATNTQLVTVIK